MVVYAPVSSGLKKNHTPAELMPGDAFLVRFKNSRRGYRTDIWIGVILTEEFGPGRYLNGRPKKAKQADGSWTAPLNERIYPVYMPGKNSFRWVCIHDIFHLPRDVPTQFCRSSDREDAEIFRNLQKIALQNLDLRFWEVMAEKELQIKGKKSRVPELVLPDGYENMLVGLKDLEEDSFLTGVTDLPNAAPVPGSSSGGSSPTTLASSSPMNETEGPARAEATTEDAQAHQYLKFPGESSTFLNYAGGRHQVDAAYASSSSARTMTEGQGSPSRAQLTQVKSETKSPKPVDGKAISRPSRKHRKSIYSVTVTELIRKIVNDSPEAEDLSEIVRAVLEIRTKPEAAKIKSFDETGEFAPRIVQILNHPSTEPANDSISQCQGEFPLGDCNRLGRNYKLEGINDSKVLQHEVTSLGVLYQYARRFNKPALIKMITTKLQIAWNSYPGLSQLDPILDVAMMAFQVRFVLEKKDDLQEWILKFIADTKDLFPLASNAKYWVVMREIPVIIDAVTEKRDELLRQFPKRYNDVRVLLRERGVEQF